MYEFTIIKVRAFTARNGVRTVKRTETEYKMKGFSITKNRYSNTIVELPDRTEINIKREVYR